MNVIGRMVAFTVSLDEFAWALFLAGNGAEASSKSPTLAE